MTVFGRTPDGRKVDLLRIGSDRLTLEILTLGARLNVVQLDAGPSLALGSATVDEALGDAIYAGPIIGPIINRIGGGQARLNGQVLTMERNQAGKHALHSGSHGTQSKIWHVDEASDNAVSLSVLLPDGEGGLPGNRRIAVSYSVADTTISIDITGSTDAETFLNIGHHGYWNLDGRQSWEGHRLQVAASHYLPTDADTVPTGEVRPVDNSIYDLRQMAAPSDKLDTNFCLDPTEGPVASLVGTSGRQLDVFTDAPGFQVYTGKPTAIALEPQVWPDAPNHDGFPSISVKPGELFRQTTRYVLS